MCYLEDLWPGRRLKFFEQRAGLRTTRCGNIVRPASTDEASKEFRRGTFLVKFDGSSAVWKQLDQEDWPDQTRRLDGPGFLQLATTSFGGNSQASQAS